VVSQKLRVLEELGAFLGAIADDLISFHIIFGGNSFPSIVSGGSGSGESMIFYGKLIWQFQ
jgi:hypothetical protein